MGSPDPPQNSLQDPAVRMSTQQDWKGSYDNALEAQRTKQQVNTPRSTPPESWADYVKRMKGEHNEQFLTGDLEGYRRGYTHGRRVEKQKRTDFSIGVAAMISLVFAALGFAVGFAIAVAL
jgi:hypothetical protein